MKALYIIIIAACIVNANPIMTRIINEFQVAPSNSERIEFHYLVTPVQDTLISDSISLLNTTLITPGGTSLVDTALYLEGTGYAIIDTSILSGNFGLPDDSGFITTYDGGGFYPFWDSISYPNEASTPPAHYSAAKFHCRYWYQELPITWYLFMEDWYIDLTPTFGLPNDDYPGCTISGHVYDYYGQPLSNARVTATAQEDWYEDGGIVNPPQYHKSCTTYTASDGSYSVDSLLPWQYYVDVWANGYVPDTQLTGTLRCTEPITNLDFYLLIGITEDREHQNILRSYVYPNPFFKDLNIKLAKPHPHIEIYDVTGKLYARILNRNLSSHIRIDGTNLSRGIYFISVPGQKIKIIKL